MKLIFLGWLRKFLPPKNGGDPFCGETVKWSVYWILAIITLGMLIEYQLEFWGQTWGTEYQGVPQKIRYYWVTAVALYGPFIYLQKQWGGLKNLNQNGELWGILVIANPGFMWACNVIRDTLFHEPYLKYPDGAIEQSLAALALISFSQFLKYKLQRKNGCNGKNGGESPARKINNELL